MKHAPFKIQKQLELYVSDGYFSNGVWLFKSDWLKTLSCKKSAALRAELDRVSLENVTARVSGRTVKTKDLSKIVSDLSKLLPLYRPAYLEEACLISGYIHGRANNHGVVSYQLRDARVDKNYAAALAFDPDALILTKGPKVPVLLTKSGEILAAIATHQKEI